MYAGCVAERFRKKCILELIKTNGFTNVTQCKRTKPIHIPDDILKQYLNEEEFTKFKTLSNRTGIFSITVYAEKSKSCCGTDCCN